MKMKRWLASELRNSPTIVSRSRKIGVEQGRIDWLTRLCDALNVVPLESLIEWSSGRPEKKLSRDETVNRCCIKEVGKKEKLRRIKNS